MELFALDGGNGLVGVADRPEIIGAQTAVYNQRSVGYVLIGRPSGGAFVEDAHGPGKGGVVVGRISTCMAHQQTADGVGPNLVIRGAFFPSTAM